MEHVAEADGALAGGRFLSALDHLAAQQSGPHSRQHLAHTLATADALQRTGRGARGSRLATTALRAVDRTQHAAARGLAVLARAAFDAGRIRRSLRLFRQAHARAERALDPELTAGVLLDTLSTVADWLPAADASQLESRCEQVAARAVRPHIAARFHVVVASRLGQGGAAEQSAAHVRRAELLLGANPNPWLQGQLHLIRAHALANGREPLAATREVRRALACTRQSGHAATRTAADLARAQVHLAEGRIERADARCRSGLASAGGLFAERLRLLLLQAELELARNRRDTCAELLDQLRSALPHGHGSQRSWHALDMLALQARLHLGQGGWREALATCESGAAEADRREDPPRGAAFAMLAADALIAGRRPGAAATWIERAEQRADAAALAARVQVDRVRAALLAQTAGADAARRRFEITLRALAATGSAAARMDAAASFLRTMRPVDSAVRRRVQRQPANLAPLIESAQRRGAQNAQSAAAPVPCPGPVPLGHAAPLVALGERPALLAHEVFVLLRDSGCAAALAIVERRGQRVAAVPAHAGWTAEQAAQAHDRQRGVRTLPVGPDLAVLVLPRADAVSQAIVRDVHTLTDSARARAANHAQARETPPPVLPDPAADGDDGIIAAATMAGLLARARRIAATNEPVLLVGETGTGKELVARYIHRHSPRADRQFTPFNCAEIPTGMAESVLFGHCSGAYTGATRAYGGIIRGAAGGTLLLDELTDLEPAVQPKLLRFLDRGDVHPLGEQKPVPVDVRIIAATNSSLDRRLRDGELRKDLYFRLNILRIDLPPLRARRGEIPLLVHHFLRRFGAARDMPGLRVTDEVLDELQRHDWPGNVRQLENHLRRLAALATDEVLTRSALQNAPGSNGPYEPTAASQAASVHESRADVLRVPQDQPLGDALAAVERALIRRALAATGGNAAAAARRLGVSRRGLLLKRQRLGIGEFGVD